MKLHRILLALDGQAISETYNPDLEISGACGADLMSDVLSFSQQIGTILLTGLTNPQVVRTAEMASAIAIMFVRGKMPPAETVRLAEEKGIPLFSTEYSMFEACGRLYSLGLESCDVHGDERQQASRRLVELMGTDV